MKIKQKQIARRYVDTVANAKLLQYNLNELIYVEETNLTYITKNTIVNENLPRIIVASSGIRLYATNLGGNIGDILKRTNHVLIQSKADFPTPSSSTITLLPNTIYEINGNINLGTDSITLNSNSVILGFDKFNDKLTYTGTGNLINSTNQSGEIHNISLIATNGDIFNLSGNGSNNFEITNTILESSDGLGELSEFNNCVFKENSLSSFNTGIIFSDNKHIIITENIFDSIATSPLSFLTLNDVNEIVHIQNNIFKGGNNITCLDLAPVSSVNELNVIGNTFTGISLGAIYLDSNIDVENNNYTFSNNRGLVDYSDVSSKASYRMESNTTVTTISSTSVWVKVAGTTVSYDLHRWTMPLNNRLQYNGKLNIIKQLNVSFSLVKQGGGRRNFEFSIFKNGVKLTDLTINQVQDQRFEIGSLTTLINASAGDYFELYVRNIDNTNNVTIRNLNMTIK